MMACAELRWLILLKWPLLEKACIIALNKNLKMKIQIQE